MNEPLVSVIVPAYNVGPYVRDTLNSVLEQTYSNWECIIVNDGSTDNTRQVIEAFIAQDPRFKLIDIPNSGVCVARNTAVDHAHGTYILPLDGDDKIADTYIERCVAVVVQFPETKLVYCKAAFFGEKEGPWDLPVFNYDDLLLYNHIFCTALFRKEEFLAAGGYDKRLIHGWEDWDLWIKFLDRDAKVVRIEEVLFYYRIKNISRSTNVDADTEKARVARLHIYMNNVAKYASSYPDPIMAYRDINYYKGQLQATRSHRMYRLYKSLKGLLGK